MAPSSPSDRVRPRALITGVAGQDGIHLARHLLSHDYEVVGTVRPGGEVRAVYLSGVEVVPLDQRDRGALSGVLDSVRPDELYNLAGITSVGASWRQAEAVAETNAMSVLRILEELVAHRARHGRAPRFFQPSSSEMFGVSDQQPQTEGTPHHPRSPYAASKSFAHHLTVNYRESYDLYASTATLYNHESPLRGQQFVTRKITRAVAEIHLGLREGVALGNLDVRRDWGFAGDHARAMHLALQQDEPGDYIVATGISHALSDILDIAFAEVGITDSAHHVSQDPAFMRPADVVDLVGDPTKAMEQLGWRPAVTLEQVIRHMVRVDVERLRSGVEEHPDYLVPTGVTATENR